MIPKIDLSNYRLFPELDWRQDPDRDTRSFTQYLMQQAANDAWRKWDFHLEQNVKLNLERLGFTFATQEQFLDFIGTRLTKINFSDVPDTHQIWLDYVDNDNPGTFITSYSTRVSIDWGDNRAACMITYTIG